MNDKLTYEQAIEVLDLAIDKGYNDLSKIIENIKLKTDSHDYELLLEEYHDNINFHNLYDDGIILYNGLEDIITEQVKIDNDIMKKINWDVIIIAHDAERVQGEAHFHIENRKKNFYCAVCLDKNEYFIHNKYKDKLNKKEKEMLDEILHTKYEDTSDINYWQAMCRNWNNIQNSRKISMNMKDYPDYLSMTKSYH